jgi:hypothetical protein
MVGTTIVVVGASVHVVVVRNQSRRGLKMKSECCVCHRPQDPNHCEVIEPTTEEKRVMETMGLNPVPKKLFYCKPCWGILSDKQAGAQLLRGIGEQGLLRAGVIDAERRATEFHRKLLSKVKP